MRIEQIYDQKPFMKETCNSKRISRKDWILWIVGVIIVSGKTEKKHSKNIVSSFDSRKNLKWEGVQNIRMHNPNNWNFLRVVQRIWLTIGPKLDYKSLLLKRYFYFSQIIILSYD